MPRGSPIMQKLKRGIGDGLTHPEKSVNNITNSSSYQLVLSFSKCYIHSCTLYSK